MADLPFTLRRRGPPDAPLRSSASSLERADAPGAGAVDRDGSEGAERPFIHSVSGLQRRVRESVERAHGNLLVGGEVSSLTLHSGSGHAYFTLKDQHAQLKCVMWREQVQRLGAKLANGHEVILRGRLTVFERSGQLQMTVLEVHRQGDGAAEEAYRLLAEKLRREGLTAPARKRALPLFPRAVGVVTSRSGAALRDVVRTALRRDPFTRLLISPCSVQGDDAAHEIVRALQRLDAQRICEVIILARGGGSREDLWVFNHEAVARAIAACSVPVVTGIGHETDTSIADLVADLSCSTPTAAAEHVVPSRAELRRRWATLENRLHRAARSNTSGSTRELLLLERRLKAQDPQELLHRRAQAIDELTTRAERCLRIAIGRREQRHARITRRLARCEPRAKMAALSARITLLRARMTHALRRHLESDGQELAVLVGRLESLSPVGVLARGYALARTDAGFLVRKASEVSEGDRLTIRVAEGEIFTRVEATAMPAGGERER